MVVEADRRKLDGMSRTHAHQGVIALAAVREYATVDDILNAAREKGEAPLIVVCDELSDPHNLGAVIRTAECRRGPRGHHPQAPLRRPDRRGGQDLRRGGGPCAGGPGAQPARPAQGAEGGGRLGVRHRRRRHHQPSIDADLKGPAAIVIGSEGDGMGRLVAENCDFTGQHPHAGQDQFPERLRRRCRPAVRGGASAPGRITHLPPPGVGGTEFPFHTSQRNDHERP